MDFRIETTPSSRRRGIRPVAVLGTLGLVVGIAGCGGDGAGAETTTPHEVVIIQPGAPGEPSARLTPEYVAAIEPVPHTEQDILFSQMMIAHHGQALEMTELAQEKAGEQVKTMALRMQISQTDEVAWFKDWLERKGEPPPEDLSHVHGEHLAAEPVDLGTVFGDPSLMPGMLTDEEMAELAAAEDGDEFDILFMQMMRYHHLGALAMIQQLVDAGGGQEVELGVFSNHIYADQEIEINRMELMLTERGALLQPAQ